MARKLDIEADDSAMPVATRIRGRLQAAGKRFHANDSIFACIEPGELAALQGEVEQQLRGVLKALVIDTESDHNTQDTARRVLASLVPDHRAGMGGRHAQRELGVDRIIQIRASGGVGDGAPADPGRGSDPTGRSADG